MNELLERLTKHVADLSLECDGASRIAHLILLRARIAHRCMGGIVTMGEQFIPVHNWLEVDDPATGETFIIDYRLNPWLTGDLPVGVFQPDDYPALRYDGFAAPFSTKSCLAVELSLEWDLVPLSKLRSEHDAIKPLRRMGSQRRSRSLSGQARHLVQSGQLQYVSMDLVGENSTPRD